MYSHGDAVERLILAIVQVSAVYYGAAVLLHVIVPSIISVKYLQTNKLQALSDVKRDALRSFLPLVIKGITLFIAETLHRSGYGVLRESPVIPMFQKMLQDPTDVISIVALWFLLDLFHDTWFYFAHRALHCRWVLRNVHYMHHQSTTPSAFSGYSFHWAEAIVVFSVAIVEIFLFPVPVQVIRIYELWMIIIHIGGHCGYEFFPLVPHAGVVLWACCGGTKAGSRWLNDVEHHDIHHRSPCHHFSLYFTHWDYIMGSMHPAYVQSRASEPVRPKVS